MKDAGGPPQKTVAVCATRLQPAVEHVLIAKASCAGRCRDIYGWKTFEMMTPAAPGILLYQRLRRLSIQSELGE